MLAGNETPYYCIGNGNHIAYHRVGNQNIPADARKSKELVLRGSDVTYNSDISKHDINEFSFTKHKSCL